MGKKGKVRLRAALAADIQRQASRVRLSRPKNFGDRSATVSSQRNGDDAVNARRPRLTGFSLLKHVLRERQSQEQYELMERRRRAGFLPQQRQGQGNPETSSTNELQNHHPPGWMLRYNEAGHDDNDYQEGVLCSPTHRREASTMQRQRRLHRLEQQKSHSVHPIHHEAGGDKGDYVSEASTTSKTNIESLQSKCLRVLGRYMMEYLEALGRDELHAAISMLPADTIATLSINVSSTLGVNNDLCYVLGKHPHIRNLSLRAAGQRHDASNSVNTTLTDEGLLSLLPHLPKLELPSHEGSAEISSWEDYLSSSDDDDDKPYTKFRLASGHVSKSFSALDMLQVEGTSVGLQRLELIDCQFVSARAVQQLLQRCSSITHLSFRGSSFLTRQTGHPDDDEGEDEQSPAIPANGNGSSNTDRAEINHDDDEDEYYGPESLLLQLPDLLPYLQVLDVSHCAWVTTSLLQAFGGAYAEQREQQRQEEAERFANDTEDVTDGKQTFSPPPPTVPLVYCVGGMHQDW